MPINTIYIEGKLLSKLIKSNENDAVQNTVLHCADVSYLLSYRYCKP